MLLVLVDAVYDASDVHQTIGSGIEVRPLRQPLCPCGCGPAAPVVRWTGEQFAAGAVETARFEIVEAAGDITQRCAATIAVESGLDIGFLTGLKPPGARKPS